MSKEHIQTLRKFIEAVRAGKDTPTPISQVEAAVDALELALKPKNLGVTRYMLEDVKKDPALREKLKDSNVLIYAREHMAYWRRGGQGYSEKRKEAGLFTFARAWEVTQGLDPSKGIEFELVGGGK
jgi:hypothetical protein